MTSIYTLTLQYTDSRTRILNLLALVSAIIHGSAWPLFGLLFGKVVDAASSADIQAETRQIALYLFFLGIGVIVSASVWNAILSRTAIERSNCLRMKIFNSLIFRNTGWFDVNGSDLGSITAKLNTDVEKFKSAIGVRLGMFVVNLSQGFFGVGLSFINGWQLSLLVTGCIPLIAVSTFFLNSSVSVAMEKAETVYASANSVCEESVFAIKTVRSFNGETKQIIRHDHFLAIAFSTIRRIILKMAIPYGLCNASVFITFAIAFAFGGFLVANNYGGYNAGNVGGTLVMILTGAFGFGQTATGLQAFAEGLCSMKSVLKFLSDQKVWEGIEDTQDRLSTKLLTFQSIAIRNISFRYSDNTPVVFSNISFAIEGGKKIAIVGESGSGKSSLISLLMRFYDPIEGEIVLNDSTCFREINVHQLRALFGYVGQEPVLFGGSIRSNLVFGLEHEISDDVLWSVLDAVNASDFVRNLPDQLDTVCGQSAGLSHLSGGQKQRIAIARALLRRPKILLLDEATSALDNESEQLVMKAIENVRTVYPELAIVAIAHRLSTVKDADQIFVLGKVEGEVGSRIVERGSHVELANVESGVYASLLAGQSIPTIETNKPTYEKTSIDRTETKSSKMMVENSLVKNSKSNQLGAISVFKKLVHFSVPQNQRWMYLVGSIGALIKGVGFPIDAILFSSAIGHFYIADPGELMHAVGLVSIWYLCLAIGVFVGTFLAVYYFSLIGESVKSKLRSICFSSLVRKDIEFFDDSKNAPSIIANEIATNTAKAAGFVSLVPRVTVEATATMIAGTIISFSAAPKLAAVLVATFPVLFVASAISMAAWMGADSSSSDTGTGKERLTKITSETFSFIKTIRSCQAENQQRRELGKIVSEMNRAAIWKSLKAGTAFGLAMSSSIFAYSLGYWYGGILVADGEISLTNMLIAVMGPMLTSLGIGEALAFLPDIGESLTGSRKVLDLLCDHQNDDNYSKELFSIEQIEFRNVDFAYPLRSEAPVLNDFCFSIPRGTKVGFVGPSGSGKSTVFAILQRFYEPASGEVIVNDNLDMASIDPKIFRSKIGYVGQEPVLFDMSLRENVLYGVSRELQVDEERALLSEIRIKANLDFVKSDTDWDMSVGPRGSRLSGGQKQRVAIARAIAKDPDVFLLDEATSALDTVSESLIHNAMNTVTKTVIVIAHRLSTVVNSDIIFVMENGQIVEHGSHTFLINKDNSLYTHLYRSGS
jgi:ABC-type multidrug transport system fused ATPase/permease subunit